MPMKLTRYISSENIIPDLAGKLKTVNGECASCGYAGRFRARKQRAFEQSKFLFK